MSELTELEQKIEEELFQRMADAPTQEAREAAGKAFIEIQEKKISEAIADLEQGTGRFLSLIDDLTGIIQKMGPNAAASGRLKDLRDQLADIYGGFRSDKGLPNASGSDAEAKEPTKDEASEQPSGSDAPLAKAGDAGPGGGGAAIPTISKPRPVNSKDYAALSDEYVRFFLGAAYKNNPCRADAQKFAQTAFANKARYEAVGNALGGIPWWFIAGIHMLESSFRFDGHFHNGDPLARRTVRVPAGRPVAPPAAGAGAPYTWEESAIDALKLKKFDQQTDWSLPRALFRWEQYNGFGYRPKGVPSPYLWSFSSIYDTGKFVRDGQFNPGAESKQCGAAVLLKALRDAGRVDLKLDFFDEKGESGMANDFDQHAKKVEEQLQPTVDGPIPANNPFEQFVSEAVAGGRMPKLRHFKPGEFLVKGGLNATLHINNDPPRELWPNALALMRVVDEFRERIGHPVVINSAYRSEAYNKAVGGVSGSQHKKFQAADIKVKGFGNPAEWAALLKRMRKENFFHGGIGIYNTFVHVDTRGWDADW